MKYKFPVRNPDRRDMWPVGRSGFQAAGQRGDRFSAWRKGCRGDVKRCCMRRILWMAVAVLLLFCACGGRDSDGDSSSRAQSGDFGAAPEGAQEDPADAQAASDPSGGENPDAQGESAALTMTVTVPEGYTLARIGMLLEEKGFCTAEEFVEATQEGDYSSWPMLSERAENENRCFSLEGYLFPDTYEVYTGEGPQGLIIRMLNNTDRRLDSAILARIEQSGYSLDEILTLASVIEKEAFGPEQMPAISSVLHNRLEIDMKLQCDVTYSYVKNVIMHFAADDPERFGAWYDTYECPALPAGPICNPGIEAVRAALEPADTDYLYFVTDDEKNYYYSADWEGHQANIAAAKAVNAALEAAGEAA